MTDETPETEQQPEPATETEAAAPAETEAAAPVEDAAVAKVTGTTDEAATAETTEAAADEGAPVEEASAEEAATGEAATGEAVDAEVAGEEPVAEGATEPVASDEPLLDIGSEADPVDSGPRTAAVVRGRVDRHGVAMGTGRRKTAVARVRISDGDGKLTVNGREFAEYFPLERDQQMIQAPLQATDALGKVDVWVRVKGGGPTGQTGAVVLGIARALQVKSPELHEKLSEGGYLTRDGRMVERKKYGLRKARRAFQFSKR